MNNLFDLEENFEIETILADLYSQPTLQELGTWSLDATIEATSIIFQVLSA